MRYGRLPFTGDTIPGAVMEGVLAHIREGKVLKTYDFVDVIQQNERVGWQVKSTKCSTPVTWKRAKIPNASALIENSRSSARGVQELGNTIIDFCNLHARQSLALYKLDAIGYSRLVVFPDGNATYFERVLCTSDKPDIFQAADFVWSWSQQKQVKTKEQLPALHGFHLPTNKKWWAWHGLGENQLHFSGERVWWPDQSLEKSITFKLPSAYEKLSYEELIDLLARADIPN
jgi:hypothetical protein